MLWTIPALAAVIVAALAGPSGSLAQVSFYESVRRALMPPVSRSLTMSDIPQAVIAGAPPASTDERTVPPVGQLDPDKAIERVEPTERVEPENAADKAASDEHEWRARMTDARDALERDQVLLDAMQSRINALTNDVAARDDPAQRAVLEKQRLRALDEFARLTTQVAKDKEAIANIEEDARKKGIPPGWIRSEPIGLSSDRC